MKYCTQQQQQPPSPNQLDWNKTIFSLSMFMFIMLLKKNEKETKKKCF